MSKNHGSQAKKVFSKNNKDSNVQTFSFRSFGSSKVKDPRQIDKTRPSNDATKEHLTLRSWTSNTKNKVSLEVRTKIAKILDISPNDALMFRVSSRKRVFI